jgi:hypothetical protein
VKLNDLKVKELKKQVPNTRLRPLKGKRKTVDSGSQNYSTSKAGTNDLMAGTYSQK